MTDETPNPETHSLAAASSPEELMRRHAAHRAMEARPERIGPYRILEILGEGGMGVVYLAEQTKPIHRRVALKIIKLGMDTKQVIARFEVEREALALMNHPHVAKVFDAGATEQGRPYFVMEYVEGVPLTAFCDAKRLSMHERLALFVQVCQAIQHAHQKGIIHRDIKPSNVLVSEVDGKPAVKVIDFGIAKATQQRLTEATYFTEQGQLIGTPAYMSPEQADARAQDIDTRTDVYSLGVLLYEMLVGALPFDAEELRRAALTEIMRIVREVDPPKPSTRLAALGATSTSIADSRGTTTGTLARQLRGDLDWIVMKCIEKDRTRRYETANALVLEIQRYLNNEPVLAGPPSATYRMGKFVRRNRVAVAAGSAVILALTIGLIGTALMYVRAERERTRAETALVSEAQQRQIAQNNEQRARDEAARAEQETEKARRERDKTGKFADFMEETLKGVGPSVALGRDTKMLKELMDGAAKRIETGELNTASEAEVRLRLTIGTVYREIAEFDAAKRMLAPAVDLAARVHGHESAERASALNQDAERLELVGRSTEALPQFEEALAMRQRLFPGDHPDVAKSLSNVSFCLDSLGRSAEALPKLEQSLAMTQRLFAGDHREVATSLNNVASCLDSLDRSTEALPKHAEALAMYQRLFPGDHPDVARSLNNIALCLHHSLGRAAEALPKHEEALAMRQRLFPGDHPDVATSLNNVGSCLDSLGRPAEALPKYEEALVMFQSLLPGDHPAVATSLNNIAGCLNALGRSAEALLKYEESLSMLRRLLPGDHPHVALSLNNVAACLDSLGRPAEALPKYDETLAMFTRVLSPDHWRLRAAEIGKGAALVDLERYPEAEDILVPLWATIAESADLPKKHKIRCLEALVKLFESMETIAPGQGHAAEAAEWRAKLDGESSKKASSPP